MDYKRNKRYFKRVNYAPSIILFVIGGLTFLIGLSVSSGGAIFVGLIFIAIGIGLIVIQSIGKMTDEEYDEAVFSMLHDMDYYALEKLGVDEDEVKEIDPIYFDGYDFDGADYRTVKRGKDGVFRTNRYKAAMLFFSQNEVHCYTYIFDTCMKYQSETTDVYFYRDIVSVSTASDTKKIGPHTVNYEYFQLTTAGGTALSVSLRDVKNAQRSINAMRALLKSKKQQL